MKKIFQNQDLPLADMEKLNLYKDSKLSLDQEDINALSSGRRTALIRLENLKAGGLEIAQLDAKLSVVPEPDGKLALKIHPIYKQPQLHPLLPPHEADLLIGGKIDTLQKIYQDGEENRAYNFEYDPETKEFISYDPKQVTVPETVNMQVLTQVQKEAFRNGAVITLDDGTRLQYRAADQKGIRADRAALILGVVIGGNISYTSIRDVKNLLNNPDPQKYAQSEAYLAALQQFEQMRQASASRHTDSSNREKNGDYVKGYTR